MFIAEWILGKKNAVSLICTPSEEDVAKRLTRKTMCIETGVNIEELHNALKEIKPAHYNRFTVYTLGRVCYQKHRKQSRRNSRTALSRIKRHTADKQNCRTENNAFHLEAPPIHFMTECGTDFRRSR